MSMKWAILLRGGAVLKNVHRHTAYRSITCLIILGTICAIAITYYDLTAAMVLIAVPLSLFLCGAILNRWRVGIYALTFYMPFSGLVAILFGRYAGSSGLSTIFKDFLLVIPTYIAFMRTYWPDKRKLPLLPDSGRFSLVLMALFSVLVMLHLFNPRLVNLTVGLIGVKVWLFYMPLYVLGYHFICSKAQLMHIMRLLLPWGMIPVLFTIAQGLLCYSGHNNLAYLLHGELADAATQLNASFAEAGGQGLVRVPGLFTFALQNSLFLFTMLGLAFGLWRDPGAGIFDKRWYFIVLCATAIALFISGVRAVYVLLPGFFLCTVLIDVLSQGMAKGIWAKLCGAAFFCFMGAFVLLNLMGASSSDFWLFGTGIAAHYISPSEEGSMLKEFGAALDLTWLGLGPGMNTVQARYAFGSGTMVFSEMTYVSATSGTVGLESFHAKSILEVGLPGLILAAALLVSLLLMNYRQFKRLKDKSLRAIGTGLLSFEILCVAYLYKGPVIDYEPVNIYFWLFAGVLLKLPALDASLNHQDLKLGSHGRYQ